jgi:DNA (cytosine-5)-methyltransferase 1
MAGTIKTLSLFSGAGGLDLGFHQAGFDIVACVEIEEAYCKTLRANSGGNRALGPHAQVFCEDVNAFDPTPFVNVGIECIIGGPPCQTFSAAGRRSGGVIGTGDARGRLFERYCEILSLIQPRVFVFENVYGLPGANGGGPWREMLSAFSDLGYQLKAEVVDAADYGVPQHRERLIMVGYRDADFQFPLPTCGPDSTSGAPLVSIRTAIADLQSSGEPFHDGLGGMYGHLLPLVPEGLNYAFFTAEMGHPEPQFAWRSKFHDLLYKVDPDAPARTLKAQPGKFTGPFHWKNRHFTIDELRRLQSFPDDYEIVGRYNQVVEQIGNSVPPRLAYVMASAVRDQLLRPTKQVEFAVRPFGFSSTFRQRQRERSKTFREIAARAIEQQYPKSRISNENVEPIHEDYFVRSEGHFKRAESFSAPSHLTDEERAYKISVRDSKDSITLRFERYASFGNVKGFAEITGLKKYLGRIDRVDIETSLVDYRDVFHLWAAVERALIKRSRFFSLIDIYGHYANRGDTVQISCNFGLHDDPTDRLLHFVSNSDSCGAFLTKNQVADVIDCHPVELEDAISNLRDERFDVRTKKTHPIIKNGSLIATYPFPLLSAKALVVSKVEMLDESDLETTGDQIQSYLPL